MNKRVTAKHQKTTTWERVRPLLVASLLAATGTTAVAEENAAFSIERWRWSQTGYGVLDVESGRIGNHKEFTLGLWMGYANDPLVAYQDIGGTRERVGALVHHRVGGSLVASVALFDRVELGAEIPLIMYQFRSSSFAGATSPLTALTKAGLGDIRLVPKLGILRQADVGLDLAVLAAFTVPSGGGDNYVGNDGVTFAPELALSRHLGATRVALNLGYRMRKDLTTANLEVGDEVGARLGVGVPLVKLGDRSLDLGWSFSAATNAKKFVDATFNQVPIETDLGLTLPLGPVDVLIAGGVGLLGGFGTPDWRALAGLRFHSLGGGAMGDEDGDGIYGAADKCPEQPEDRDGIEDRDGCPDLDNDKDGVLDAVDKCPAEAEDQDGFDDADGCPDLDNDGDGIADREDKCVGDAEVVNGFEDTDGCPDQADRDGDGVADATDGCPEQAEDKDGFEDADGCPDADNDKDGVLDAVDNCRDEAGPGDNGGCPDKDGDGDGVVDRLDNCPKEPGSAKFYGCKKRQLVSVNNGQIEIMQQVFFDTNKARIQKRSFKLLDNVASVVAAHPEIRVEIQGHTDDRGDDAANLDLSTRRAEAVMAYLIEHQVTQAQLEYKGYGETQPIDSNKTNKGRAKNRRVVFKIIGIAATTIDNQGQPAPAATPAPTDAAAPGPAPTPLDAPTK